MFKRLSGPVELEDEVLAFWKERNVFARSLEAAKDRPTFVFYEGPPTANGTPHNGHVLTRVVKDVIPRYKSMRGYLVHRKGGWDTHGLPVEVEVEKTLNIHGREAIEAYGLDRFSQRCVESVFTYVDEWEQLTEQIGFWVDLPQAYVTFHRSYVESVWWALARLFDRGLLYQGHKVVWWWPQGGTTLSAGEVGMGYRTVDDPAITVRFRDADDANLSYLAWTTTPWTLPSNVALAVSHKVRYAFCDDPAGGEVVVAEALAESLGLTPKRTVLGAELVGRRYVPLYDFGPAEGGDTFVIVTAHHVTTDAGTGIVHTAPAFGEDDMVVAREHGLGLLQWIEPDGRFPKHCGFVAGMFCKDADKPIIHELDSRGLLFKRESYRHDYPFCWRADSDPLIQYARPAWFIRTTDFVEDALKNNAGVTWTPEHIQEGRFGDFLRNNVDWALSRERFWGTPLPIWECSCGHRVAAPSIQALKDRGATGFDESVDEHMQIHRPWVDRIVCPCEQCGGSMQRVTEVIDCWFDSGCMPFAQWGFPHQGQDDFRTSFPADFISEAIDQTRGWFYSLLMISTMLFDDDTCAEYGLKPVGFPRPYRSCVVLGHVCDMDGRKESKSKGNYTSPNLVLRGKSRLNFVADPSLKPGTIGLMKDQITSLDLTPSEHVSIFLSDSGPVVTGPMVPAVVKAKDTIHVHPDDLAAIGLPAGGVGWFRIPIDPPGADAFRWLFCSASPAWSNTRLSLRAIREGQREFLIRLRNVVQFFTIYANIAHESGSFRPEGQAPSTPAQRSLLDRWILHEQHATLQRMTAQLDELRIYDASRELIRFVDALSNWYVRRSRARFWSEGSELQDALWTLHTVLLDTARMIAPFVPFTAEAMFQALSPEADPDSVHLQAWPQVDPALLDPELASDMAIVRTIASLGLSARTASRIKVRQPLSAITVVLADLSKRAAVERMSDLLCDELNVREVRFAADADAYVSYQVKPNFKKLGAALGKDMKRVAGELGKRTGADLKAQLDAGGIRVQLDDREVLLNGEDVQISVVAKGEYEAASAPEGVVVLSTHLDDDLKAEGVVRELVNRVAGVRKELDLGYTQRIELWLSTDADVMAALERFGKHLQTETLTRTLHLAPAPDGVEARAWDVEGHAVSAGIRAL